ncbi:hypothetical protein [Winogradskyella sp.]|uniref:hypothetical protein n=1 Tax=Winogradskyella sp. TaxID=1883156 RepID=UPI0025E71F1C|nr:hypothetical protein [Winogradskyella sp.]
MLLTTFNCQVEEDKYPDVPFLNDIIVDSDYFIVTDIFNDSDKVEFLENDNFFISNSDDQITKIVTSQGKVVLENKSGSYPNYFDTNGNFYKDGKMYYGSNYEKTKPVVVINVLDSMYSFKQKITNNGEITDSITNALIEDYNWKMYISYDLIKERKAFLKTAIDTVKIKNDTLIDYSSVRKNNYLKKAIPFKEFDEPIIINKHSTGGHFGLPCIDYMSYYEIGKNKIRVKTKDHTTAWKLYSVKDKMYLFDGFNKLYQVKNQ